MADLSVNIAGITFKNSVWVASGEPTESFDKMKRGIDMGAGAVVAKSFDIKPETVRQTDLAKYCFLGYERRPVFGKAVPKLYTLYSRTGAVQKSEDEWIDELSTAQKYASKFDSIVIGSVSSEPETRTMIQTIKKMEEAGLKAVELALSCPHGEEMQDKTHLLKATQAYFDVTKAITRKISIPVFIKISPQQSDLVVTAKSIQEAGAAGITCHNRFLGFCIDIETGKPHIWGYAGVGGPWMLPLVLRWVAKIYTDCPNLPILGSSGAYDWEDVVQFHMAGAKVVQFCSTIMAKGYSVIKNAIHGLNSFLDGKKYRSVRDIIGIATQAVHTYEEMYNLPEYKEIAFVDVDQCIACGKCVEVCWYGAMEEKDGTYRVNETICKGCYNCRVVCPVETCITMRSASPGVSATV